MRFSLSALTLVVIGAQAYAAQEQQLPYQWTAGQLSQPIVIDGKLDEAIWQSVEQSKTFVLHQNDEAYAQATWVKVAYDEEALYVAFYAQDSDIAANFTQQDDPTYETDDTVEVFLDPNGDGKDYYEIGISPVTYYDSVINSPNPWQDDVPWDIEGLTQAVQVYGSINDASDVDSHWTAEVRIPLASLNYNQDDESRIDRPWKVNFHRADYVTGAAQWEASAWLAWSPLMSFGFHQPEKFAQLVFAPTALYDGTQVYTNNAEVLWQGVPYQAQYYSVKAPTKSRADGWRALVSGNWHANLVYLAGDQVSHNGKSYQANWWTQGEKPTQSDAWLQLNAE